MIALLLTWAALGLAYPLFSAWLPILLSSHYDLGGSSSTYTTYRNYVIVSVCGIPGSVLAAWMIQLPLVGRKGGIALGCFLTGIFMFVFTTAKNATQNLALSSVTSFSQQMFYPALYLLTPELIPAPHRGTGDALCSAANRLLGMMAPIISVYATNATAPIYAGAALVHFFFFFSFHQVYVDGTWDFEADWCVCVCVR